MAKLLRLFVAICFGVFMGIISGMHYGSLLVGFFSTAVMGGWLLDDNKMFDDLRGE